MHLGKLFEEQYHEVLKYGLRKTEYRQKWLDSFTSFRIDPSSSFKAFRRWAEEGF